MNKQTPHIVYPPGFLLKDELDARSQKCECCGQKIRYMQRDLAKKMGVPARTISEIVTNKRPITKKTAVALAKALGTSTEVWLKMQYDYDLWLLKNQQQDDTQQDHDN